MKLAQAEGYCQGTEIPAKHLAVMQGSDKIQDWRASNIWLISLKILVFQILRMYNAEG